MSSRNLAGVLLAGLQIGVVAFVHKGLGAPHDTLAPGFFGATGFLRESALIGGFVGRPLAGGLLLCLVPAVITACLFVTTKSALARTIGLFGVIAVGVMAYYGLSDALRVWQFFHWRGSLVLIASSAAIAITLAAPLLVASWLRLRLVWRLAVYLPICASVVALIRNATGTDESLPFNLSPWPAIPLLGFEVGCAIAISVSSGLLLGLAGFLPQRPLPALRIILGALGVSVPVLCLLIRFPASPAWMIASLGAGTAAALLVLTRDARSAPTAAGHTALGLLLVLLPLASGRALADGDYAVTRHVRAQAITEALAEHFAAEDEYPDQLDALIAAGHLTELPVPRIGFTLFAALGWLEPARFHYQNFGSSFVLEFIATEWIMCSYNPPWPDEGDEYDDDAEYDEAIEYHDSSVTDEDDAEDGDTGAWNCPDTRPELW